MPSIKEIKSIIDKTPDNQAILLKGLHGIGKSRVIEDHFTALGYRVVTLFLGQMADAGDLIGLPEKIEEKILIDEKLVKINKTVFCPPYWWSFDMNEKLVIFLDELNRSKPECRQAIMDLVLNRKLNGRSLPSKTRIIAAINPDDADGYYQVDELDPALIDRFNVYEFIPSATEWLDWAIDNKIHKMIISFISKNQDHLDPITASDKGSEINKIQSSRRSWERLSEIMIKEPDIEKTKLFTTMSFGIIGNRSTLALVKHINEQGKGLSVGKILHGWNKDIKNIVETFNAQDVLHMNRQIALWLNENEDTLETSEMVLQKVTINLKTYLDTIPAETAAEFFDHISRSKHGNKKWPDLLMEESYFSDRYFEIAFGKEEDFIGKQKEDEEENF